jgi:hypothetical protein
MHVTLISNTYVTLTDRQEPPCSAKLGILKDQGVLLPQQTNEPMKICLIRTPKGRAVTAVQIVLPQEWQCTGQGTLQS